MELINKFKELMTTEGYDAYIIPTSDFHGSEYISDYFKSRAYLSGFTGSAGTLLVTKDKAYLWTDGRYFIQAQKQIEKTGIELMKMGQINVPTIIEFLADYLKDGSTLGFDGRLLSANFVNMLKSKINLNVNIIYDLDLVDKIWTNRPEMPFSLIYELDTYYSGRTYQSKLVDIKKEINKENADMYIISALEDQAWLYNLRGNDVEHTPVFLSYTIITPSQTILFIDLQKIDLTIEKYLTENDIIIKPYFSIFEYIKTIKNKRIMFDCNKVNYTIYANLTEQNTIINKQDPTLILKAIKNKTEIKNTKAAHIKDGIAFTKFMYYVKINYNTTIEMSEISVSNYLEKLRKENRGFIDLSFSTICAFKDHGAMMHYSATPETDYKINEPGFLLIDSGGHYLSGTTDITRTLALGKITDEMKVHFTTVLKSLINLSQAIFLKGVNGQNLDILARGPIWKLLIDYKCGTGHGVGHLLSVHEAPNGFRWQIVPERNDSAKFQPGMITTNEPGIYLENKYGIRIENEMLCIEKGTSEFGEFLGFETITYAPIDLDAIKVSLLSKDEKEWLNNYHQMVFDKVSPGLTDNEKEWLKNYTRKI
ncbi:MAG: aminopeptidase P family protein [Anaeroplasma sp.]